ncbi:MAG: PD-(D/E)XK nuclease family protein [Lachnospira sp.]
MREICPYSLLQGGSGAGKSEYLSRLVCEESVRRPHDNFIVVVPEQYTMETQKKLVHMHSRKGILNIDVVSFERLAYKVFEELGGGNRPVLDDTGKNLIIRRVLEKEKKKLDYFGSSIEKTGFVSELKSVISELLQYGITPQQLGEIGENVKEKQQLSAKLKDIRLVYKEFMAFLSTNYITSEEILDVLCGLVEKSKLIAGSEIIFDGFTGFTPIQYKLMRLLLVYSKGIKISVTIDKKERPTGHEGWNNLFFMSKEMMNRLIAICEEEGINVDDTVCVDRDINYRYEGAKDLAYLERNLFRYKGGVYTGTPENIRIYEGSNPKEELQYIVSEILQLTRKEGFRYRDIAVVTADLETYGKVAANMMKQNDIPAFLDYKRSVAANPYVEMLCSALEIVEKGYPYDTMFRYLRTGLTGISRHDIDMLENYCLAVGIRGSRAWHEPWKKKMKRSTYQPELETLNALREQIMAPFLNLEAVLKDKEANVRAYVTAVYEFVTALHSAEQIKALSECEPAGNEYEQLYAKVLELFDRIVELLGEENVSLKEFNRIVAAGSEEMKVGLLPPTSDCVMIGDIERTRLDNVKVLFFAGVNDGVVPKKNENCSVLSETDRSILEAQKIVLSPSAREKAFIQKFYLYLMMTKASHRLYLSYAKKSSDGKTALPSYLIRNVRRMFPDVRITDADGQDGQFVYLKIPKQDIEWNTENYIKTLSENAALLLYGTQLKGSISAFETYASCRFAYFLEYGLKLSQREEYRFAVQDFGTVLHGVLEDVSRQLKRGEKILFPVIR